MTEFKCKWCGKSYSSKQSKWRHQRTCSSSTAVTTVFKCDGCGYKQRRKDAMDRHKKKCKGHKKLHVCSICQKEFARNQHLIRHEKTHTKSTLECQECHRQFQRTDHFEKHKCTQVPVEENNSVQAESDESEVEEVMEEVDMDVQSYTMAEYSMNWEVRTKYSILINVYCNNYT